MKKLILFISVFLFVMIGGYLFLPKDKQGDPWKEIFGKPEFMNVDPNKSIDSQVRLIEMAGRKFNIPIMYIQGKLDPGEYQDALLLRFILPDFKSLWDLKDKNEYRRMFFAGHEAGLLIMPAIKITEIDQGVRSILKGYGKIVNLGREYDLEKYEGYRQFKDKLILKDHIYIRENKRGKIIDFIRCSVEGTVEKPACEHKFIDKKLRYSSSYNKKNYLSQWETQKAKAIHFIDNFEINQDTKEN